MSVGEDLRAGDAEEIFCGGLAARPDVHPPAVNPGGVADNCWQDASESGGGGHATTDRLVVTVVVTEWTGKPGTRRGRTDPELE